MGSLQYDEDTSLNIDNVTLSILSDVFHYFPKTFFF